ncbi:MAG: hypothetical protein PHS38_11065 [Bacteroidales bacterium]|nr:hypothetical protein [Bacteroidales bacterium]
MPSMDGCGRGCGGSEAEGARSPFFMLLVSGALRKCGAEQTGGRAGNAVAGAFTGGMRCGIVPFR